MVEGTPTLPRESLQGSSSGTPSRGAARDCASGAWAGRIAVAGVSSGQPCGMRDHAEILAAALADVGLSHSDHWLARKESAPRRAHTEVGRWAHALERELRERRPDAVLLHYSVFAYSYRGLPIFLGPVLSALRDSQIPVLSFMHELAFPWGLGGWRGGAWALTHRARLIELVRLCGGVALTTDFREQWLTSRPWLADRPTALAPVFSNLPVPRVSPPLDRERPRLGLFGYTYDDRAIALVLDTLAAVSRDRVEVEMALLGAPGRHSPLAERWLAGARARGLVGRLAFEGPLPAQQLADALGACDVLLFADGAGPSSRKGTLAGSLASGRPLVAVDGPRTWSELRRSDAVRVVEPKSEALAATIAALLASREERDALGARGGEFARREMGVRRSVAAVLELLELMSVAQRA